MLRRVVVALFVVVCCVLCASVSAEVPALVRYQGQLLDRKGVPLEGPYALTFRLYDVETDGSAVWTERQEQVPLTQGQFSVLLGQVQPLTNMDWAHPCWLSIQVNGDPELAPRQRITSVPLALRAQVADTLSIPLTTSTIQDDANRLVPVGAVILWTGSTCPGGYARVSALDGKFLVGGIDYEPVAGGSNTHDHGGVTGSHVLTIAEIPPHTHGLRGHADGGGGGPNWFPNISDGIYTTTEPAGGGVGHTHTIAPADSRPEFATILLCQKS